MRDEKDLFRRAAELAEVVPESMQAAAFNRALDLLLNQTGSGEGGRGADPPIPQISKKRGSAKTRTKGVGKQPATRGARVARGRPGPKAMVESLIDAGFFASNKTISDVMNHQKKRRGHTYLATELSPALLGLLREGRLEREKNANGVYEYRAVD